MIPHGIVGELTKYLARADSALPQISVNDWLVVISQTCDVVQSKLENEPYVEILLCRLIDKIRADFAGRRSTRRLDFRPDKVNFPGVAVTAHATSDRYVVPRNVFENHGPDPSRALSANAVRLVQSWYAIRYTRPAWPDSFVRRIDRKSKERLVKALTAITTDDVEVRVALKDKEVELNDDTSYYVAVFFVIDQQIWNSSQQIRKSVNSAFNEFVSALAACKGIVVDQKLSDVKSGDDFSWQMVNMTDEWNFANLSSGE